MNNYDICHRFFYNDENNRCMPNYKTVGYDGNRFFSYSTCIAKITKNINDETVTILSYDNFSVSTTKHLNYLRQSSPFSIYYLPQDYNRSDFNPYFVIEDLQKSLDFNSDKLSKKDNRKYFTDCFSMLKNTLELADFKPYFKEIKKTLKKYQSIFDDLNDPEKIKEIKRKQAKKLKIEREKLKKKLNKLTKNKNLMEQAEQAFTSDLDYATRQDLKKLINPKNELAFCWIDGENIETSKSITLPIDTIKPFLLLWKNNRLKHGMKIDIYTVLEVMPDYVKIGCHKIPTENLQNLADVLI